MAGIILPVIAVLTIASIIVGINEYTGVNDIAREKRTHMFEDENGDKYNPFSDLDPENHDDTTCPHCGSELTDDTFSYCGSCGNRV